MATGKDTQLESVIDEVLMNGNVQALHEYLVGDKPESAPVNCSQQFLTKLDKFINKSLVQRDGMSANLGFAVLHKFGRKLKLPRGCQGLPGLIAKGLPKMISIYPKRLPSAFIEMFMEPVIVYMLQWFDNCRRMWLARGPRWDDTLLRLSECFFDTLMVVHESCKEGTDQITKLFFYPIAHLVVEPGIYILIQKEAIRKFNFILGKMPANLKKNMKIETSKKAADILVKMARHILDCGDYDFQTAMVEAFCRMNTPDQRKQFADRWFSTGPVSKAFIKIKNSKFETDCRTFLSFVNERQGDRRRVYSYPCLEAYLDRFELLKPVDENLKEFWVDFNLGSHSISFYFSLAGEDVQTSKWETICITENEVRCYTVKEECKRHVLQLNLSEVVIVGEVKGSSLKLHFSCTLNIQQAASIVFGLRKNTNFIGKTNTVKTEERSSQVVPENQLSFVHSEKKQFPGQSVRMSTPAKMRVAESVVVIRNYSESEPSAAKGGGKPALQMVPSCNQINEPHRTKVTRSHSTIASDTAAKNKPPQSRLNMVAAAQGREESPELDFVPATQTQKNSCQKISVSEMLMMPTQQISSHPKPDPPRSSLSPQQCRSLSKSASAVYSSKQIHCELTKCLQRTLDDKQQSPVHEESFSLMRNKSNIVVKAKVAPIPCTSKEKQAGEESIPVGRKSRSQTPKTEDGCVITGPIAPASKALQENKPAEVKGRANQDLSTKEKRDAELAGNMVKFISRRYENAGKEEAARAWNQSFVTRPLFNSGLTSTNKNNVSGPQTWSKYQNTAETSFSNNRRNPVSVNTSSGKIFSTTTNTSALSLSGIHDTSAPLNSSKKGQAVHKEKQRVNTRLFSDTDTVATDVSWLRETGRKDKSKVMKYSRRAAARPKAVSPHTSYPSSHLDTSSKKPVKPSAKPKKSPCAKEPTEPNMPHAAGRRPRRAAAITSKSYKELDTDGSLSELESVEKRHELGQAAKSNSPSKQPTKSGSIKLESGRTESKYQHSSKEVNKKLCAVVPAVKTIKSTTSVQSANTCGRLDSSHESHLNKTSKVKGKLAPEHSKSNQGNFPSVKEHSSMLRDAWAHGQTSLCRASPFMEKMRSAERSAPALALTSPRRSAPLTPGGSPLSASPELTRQDVPSPIRPLPSPRSALSCNESFKPTSFLAAEKKRSSSKTRNTSSSPSRPPLTSKGQIPVRADRAEMFPVHQPQPSPPQSARHFMPLLTSTMDKLTSEPPCPEGRTNRSHLYDCSSTSSASQVSLSLSSIHPSVFRSSAKDVSAMTRANEKSHASDAAVQVSEPLLSGPSRKRHISTSSDSENEKKKQKRSKIRGQRSPVMKPRLLFKAYTEVCADTTITQVSSQHTSSGQWEAELDGDGDMSDFLETPEIAAKGSNLRQQFSSEVKKKFESRNKVMEVHNEQSLETMQQHISTLNTELTKYRTQRVEKVLEVLRDEIHKLEQNDTVLEDMEKDLNTYWKKQSVTFHTYQEQESRRYNTLSVALQNSVCHNLEREESLFKSQMCVIRKDMKSAQDRLLAQMQEEEIQSMKRGLHALFFP